MSEAIAPFVVKFKPVHVLNLERILAEFKARPFPEGIKRPIGFDMLIRQDVLYVYDKFGDGPPKARPVYVTSKPKWHE